MPVLVMTFRYEMCYGKPLTVVKSPINFCCLFFLLNKSLGCTYRGKPLTLLKFPVHYNRSFLLLRKQIIIVGAERS